jgi:membrane AbrB-like protein
VGGGAHRGGGRGRRAASWAALIAVTTGVALAFGGIGLPSPTLFGALLVGLAAALAWPGRPAVPVSLFRAAQAVAGVTLGAYVRSSSLSALTDDWLPVALVSAATLAVSLGAGAALARVTALDRPTAALGMVAGGASGIVSMAGDLGADDRLVAFMQYVRVLVVVLLTPLLVALAFPGHRAGSAGASGPFLGDARGWLITLAVAPVGALAGRATRLPAAWLLGPMIVAAVVTLAIPGGAFTAPPLLREAGFGLIGLQVGLRFTMDTVRQAGRLVVPVLGGVASLMLACFGLAALLALTSSVSLLDAYLATTPGGLYAVLAAAFGAGANTTFILAVQGLRLLVMVLLAPLAVRTLVRSR